MPLKLLTTIFLFCGTIIVYAQSNTPEQLYLDRRLEQHNFEEPIWKEKKQGLDYSPNGKLRKAKERNADQHNGSQGTQEAARSRRRNNFSIDSPLLSNILKFILLLTAVVVITILLKHLLGFNGIPRNKKIDHHKLDEIALEKIEDNLHESDIMSFIRQAIEQRKYDLAVRLYFLAILKELSLQKLVKWKKNKTNREYLTELRQTTEFGDFRRSMRVFENIWYGNRSIDTWEFQKIEGQLSAFLSRLQHKTEGMEV